LLSFSAYAQSFWDGNAAIQRGDSAFDAGLFAVSSAFARDTEIVIEDLASGLKTTARVTGRIDGRLDILVLLSPAAALPIGLEAGEVARVRVTVKRPSAANTPILAEDTGPTADPDRMPASVQPQASATQPVETASAAPAVAAPAVAGTAEPAKAGTSAATRPSTEPAKVSSEAGTAPVAQAVATAEIEGLGTATTPAAAETAAPAGEPAVEAATPAEEQPMTSAEDAALLNELASRTPQKQLYLPPREDEMFVYQQPVEPPSAAAAEVAQPPAEAAPATEIAQQPAEAAPVVAQAAPSAGPVIASDAGPSAPGGISQPIALADAQPPAEVRPELVDTLAAKAPAAEGGEQPRLLDPELAVAGSETVQPAAAQPATVAATAAKPPETQPATVKPSEAAPAAATAPAVTVSTPAAAVAAKPAEPKPATVQTVLDLPGKGTLSWYLQLAAYTSESMARDTAAHLAATYPVLVLAPQDGTQQLYRVFVGPLNRAESGTLLNQFRYLGFPDAFVRAAQK
jgi:cell division septation protein DedD